MTEQWLPIAGFEGYYDVSDHGRVRSYDRLVTTLNGLTQRRKGRILKPSLRAGYPFVNLQVERVKQQVHNHRLVAAAFCQKPEGCDVVNHIDGNKENNHYSNLEWTTAKGNMVHAWATGLKKPILGESNKRSKLTLAQVEEIREKLISGETGASLARAYGVHVMTISSIRSGKNWGLSGDAKIALCMEKAKDGMSRKGEKHHMVKLDEAKVIEIIRLAKNKVPQKEIAAQFGITQASVSSINTGKTWSHLPR